METGINDKHPTPAIYENKAADPTPNNDDVANVLASAAIYGKDVASASASRNNDASEGKDVASPSAVRNTTTTPTPINDKWTADELESNEERCNMIGCFLVCRGRGNPGHLPVLETKTPGCYATKTFGMKQISFISGENYTKNKKLKKFKKSSPSVMLHNMPYSCATNDLHNSLCQTCGYGGDVVCCDFCNFVYHMHCLPANEIIPQEPLPWTCPACVHEKKSKRRKKNDNR